MTNLSSRAYSHRARNGFLIALWLVKNNPEVFSCVGKNEKTILLTMLESQCNQKLGRKSNIIKIISSRQARLLWDIQGKEEYNYNNEKLMKDTCDIGIDLVKNGYISIKPDDNLEKFEIILSPEGELLAEKLNNI